MKEHVAEILSPHRGEKGALIPVLQKVQTEFGYVSEQAVAEIARFLGMSESEVYGVASFYQFRFTRPGKHTIKVCQGTACHVRGGRRIIETVQRELSINSGETTKDYKFTLERVASCFGCCALSPVMVVANTVYSRMTPAKVKEILSTYQEE